VRTRWVRERVQPNDIDPVNPGIFEEVIEVQAASFPDGIPGWPTGGTRCDPRSAKGDFPARLCLPSHGHVTQAHQRSDASAQTEVIAKMILQR